jgi:hypothetical protein
MNHRPFCAATDVAAQVSDAPDPQGCGEIRRGGSDDDDSSADDVHQARDTPPYAALMSSPSSPYCAGARAASAIDNRSATPRSDEPGGARGASANNFRSRTAPAHLRSAGQSKFTVCGSRRQAVTRSRTTTADRRRSPNSASAQAIANAQYRRKARTPCGTTIKIAEQFRQRNRRPMMHFVVGDASS